MDNIIDIRDHGGAFGGGGYGKNRPIPIENTPYMAMGGMMVTRTKSAYPRNLGSQTRVIHVDDEFIYAIDENGIFKFDRKTYAQIENRRDLFAAIGAGIDVNHAAYDPVSKQFYVLTSDRRFARCGFGTTPIVYTQRTTANIPNGLVLTNTTVAIANSYGAAYDMSIISVTKSFTQDQIVTASVKINGGINFGEIYYNKKFGYMYLLVVTDSSRKVIRRFDDNGNYAGEWSRPDGTSNLFLRGIFSDGDLCFSEYYTPLASWVVNKYTPQSATSRRVKTKIGWSTGKFYGDDGKNAFIFIPMDTVLYYSAIVKISMGFTEAPIEICEIGNGGFTNFFSFNTATLDVKHSSIVGFAPIGQGPTLMGAKILSQLEISK